MTCPNVRILLGALWERHQREAVGRGFVRGLRRAPPENAADRAAAPPVVAAGAASPAFCLHDRTAPSAAGPVCGDCGEVLDPAAGVPRDQQTQPNVLIQREAADADAPAAEADAGGPTAAAAALASCRPEWEAHIARVHDQPLEVVRAAFGIFAKVFHHQGAVSGTKARALVLVSLLLPRPACGVGPRGVAALQPQAVRVQPVERGVSHQAPPRAGAVVEQGDHADGGGHARRRR
jgi:hypothetical protein